MSVHKTDDTNDEMFDLADTLEAGDEIRIHAGEFIVDDVVGGRARPIIRVRKMSVGGYMDRTYRIESADPTDPDNDRIRIHTKYKSHWSEWCETDPEKVLRDGEPVVDETRLVTDGGVVDVSGRGAHTGESAAAGEDDHTPALTTDAESPAECRCQVRLLNERDH